MSPAWLLDILTALMVMVAAVSATRLATACLPANRLSAAKPTESRSLPRDLGAPDTDIAYLLMGIAMAGMLAPSIKTLPPHAWEAIFGLLTAWFAWRLVGYAKLNGVRFLVNGHLAAHLFHCAATLFMLVCLTTSDGMDMTGMGHGTVAQVSGSRAGVRVCACLLQRLGRLRPTVRPTLQPRGRAISRRRPSWRHRADGSVPYRHGRDHGVHAANHELTRWVGPTRSRSRIRLCKGGWGFFAFQGDAPAS